MEESKKRSRSDSVDTKDDLVQLILQLEKEAENDAKMITVLFNKNRRKMALIQKLKKTHVKPE